MKLLAPNQPSFRILNYLVLLSHTLMLCSSVYITNYAMIDLNSSDPTSFEEQAADWQSSTLDSPLYSCGTVPLARITPAPSSGNQILQRVYDSLPPHTLIIGTVTAWGSGTWEDFDSFELAFDDKKIKTSNFGATKVRWQNYECSSTSVSTGPMTFQVVLPHNASVLTVKLILNVAQANLDAWVGLRDINFNFSNSTSQYSTVFVGCSIPSGLRLLSECPCKSDNYRDQSGVCSYCSADCQKCFGPTSADCLLCQPGSALYDGSYCGLCHSSCKECSGILSTQCTSCPNGSFLYSDGTCKSYCNPPLVISVQDSVVYCRDGCPSNQYLYPNNSCISSCELPFTVRTSGSIKYCDFPCSSTEYLNYNGSCISSCNSPFIYRAQGQLKFCDFPCALDQYLNYNNTCQPSCSLPLLQRLQGNYRFCDFPCNSNQYLGFNGSCLASCPSPYISRLEGQWKYCDFPCDANNFLNYNNTCTAICPNPYVSRIEGNCKYCDFPCNSNEYLAYNTSCLSSCPSPYIPRLEGQWKHCDFPCSLGSFLTYNNTCQSACPSPYISRIEGNYKYCDHPCPSNVFLYPNSSCLSTFSNPWQQKAYNDVKLCKISCTDPLQYLYSNGTCSLECSAPFLKALLPDGVKLCNFPCLPSEILYFNNTCSTRPCQSPLIYSILVSPAYQTCGLPCPTGEFFMPNNSCSNKCPSPLIPNLDIYVCSGPCNDSYPYYYPDKGQCKSECLSPLVISTFETVKVCTSNNTNITSSQDKDGIKMAIEVTSVLGSFVGIGSAFQLTLASANPAAFALTTLMEMFQYVRYLNIRYSTHLEYMLQNPMMSPFWISFGPTLPNSWKAAFTLSDIPSIFKKYQLHSRFIVNFWTQFTCMLLVIFAGIVSWALVYTFKTFKLKSLGELARSFRILTRWNLFFLLFGSYLPWFVMHACFEYMSPSLNSSWDVLSLLICTVGVILTISTLYLTLSIARKWMQLKGMVVPIDLSSSPQKMFQRKWQAFQVLYTEYKDESIFQKSFLFYYLLRIIILYLFVGLLSAYPLVQVCVVTGLSIVILFYLFVIKPLKKESHFQVATFEFLLLGVNICLVILAVLDKLTEEGCNIDSVTDPNSEFRSIVCQIIIFINIAFTIITLYFLVSDFIKGVKYCLKITKTLKTKGSRFWLQLLVIVFQSGGMGYQQIDLQETSPPKLATFRPGEGSPQVKTHVSSFVNNSIPGQDMGQSRSISPLLKRPDEISPMSALSLSCSKMTQYGDLTPGDHEANMKENSESDAKNTSVRKNSRLNLSLLRTNPLAFWSDGGKMMDESPIKMDSPIKKRKPSRGDGSRESNASPKMMDQNIEQYDFENVPFKTLTTPKTPVKTSPVAAEDQKDLYTIKEIRDAGEETEKKNQSGFKLGLKPIGSGSNPKLDETLKLESLSPRKIFVFDVEHFNEKDLEAHQDFEFSMKLPRKKDELNQSTQSISTQTGRRKTLIDKGARESHRLDSTIMTLRKGSDGNFK